MKNRYPVFFVLFLALSVQAQSEFTPSVRPALIDHLFTARPFLDSTPQYSNGKTYCLNPLTDKIQEGTPMTAGPHGPKNGHPGQCIDTSIASPVELLGNPVNGVFNLGNVKLVFRGVGVHGFAIVDTNLIKNVIFQRERFKPKAVAAHTEIRYQFRHNGVRWFRDLNSLRQGVPDALLSDLVFSIEAIGVLGYHYDLLKGELGNYALVYRVYSMKDKQKSVADQGNNVDQWVFKTRKFSHKDSVNYLYRFVQKGTEQKLSRLYHTLEVNCTNEIFRTISELPGHEDDFSDVEMELVTLPIIAPNILSENGYLGKKLPDLIDEDLE